MYITAVSVKQSGKHADIKQPPPTIPKKERARAYTRARI